MKEKHIKCRKRGKNGKNRGEGEKWRGQNVLQIRTTAPCESENTCRGLTKVNSVKNCKASSLREHRYLLLTRLWWSAIQFQVKIYNALQLFLFKFKLLLGNFRREIFLLLFLHGAVFRHPYITHCTPGAGKVLTAIANGNHSDSKWSDSAESSTTAFVLSTL